YLERRAKREAEEAIAPHEEIVDIGAIVTRVRSLNRLETAEMRITHVATVKQTYKWVPDALGGDSLTILAAGDVIAGFDLSQLTESDVTRDGAGGVIVHLRAPQILVTRLDNNATRVINRNTGMLRREDPDMESRARAHVETMVRDEALKNGILKQAQDNGEKVLAELLHTLGFQNVRFMFARPSRSL
ncbi:MAG TPA: DUF4230 domain-containing protein, partial [Thermoanaerobaculia bacterium]|nr:DUF4230 domain-containing protein [Thermoanaerobaculia bacterium]